MPIQHKYKPHHLVLAIALAAGCAEFSLAQQLEPQVDADAKPTKTRKKTTKPVAPTVFEETTVGASALTVEATATPSNAGMNVVALPGNHAQSTVQTVLNTGNVEGEFGQVTSNLAFMTPEASYSDTQVALTRNDVPLETVATSASAQALARSVDTPKTVIANAAIGALLASNKANASIAIEQLAASSNANLAKATLSSVSPVSASMLSAMRQLDNGTSTFSDKAPRLATGSDNSSRVWLQALGNGGKAESDFDNTLKHSTQGLVLGADWRLDQQWHVGVMGGKSQTKLDARQFDGDLDSWHLGAYAVRQDGPLALRLGATYASHEGSSKRRVAFNGFNDRLKGSYDANTQQAFAEAGFNLGRNNVTVEPFASVGYQRYQRDNHTEKGGDAALKVYGQTQDNFSSTFGLRAAKLNSLDNGMRLTSRFSASWKHIYGELGSETRQQLVKGGKRFDIAGAAFDRDSLSLDAGLDLGLSANHTLGVGLTGEIDRATAAVMA